MYGETAPWQYYEIVSPSSTAYVPVLSSITGGGKFVAQLPQGTVIKGTIVNDVWLCVDLERGGYGYIAKINALPVTHNSPSPPQPLLKEATINRVPFTVLTTLLIIIGAVGLVSGLFMVSFYEQTCFLGCGERVFPLQSAGVFVLIVSIMSFILAGTVSRRLRKTFR